MGWWRLEESVNVSWLSQQVYAFQYLSESLFGNLPDFFRQLPFIHREYLRDIDDAFFRQIRLAFTEQNIARSRCPLDIRC